MCIQCLVFFYRFFFVLISGFHSRVFESNGTLDLLNFESIFVVSRTKFCFSQIPNNSNRFKSSGIETRNERMKEKKTLKYTELSAFTKYAALFFYWTSVSFSMRQKMEQLMTIGIKMRTQKPTIKPKA